MFDRINDIISGSGSLVRSEAEILATRLVRSSLGVVVVAAGVLLAVVGLGGLATAATAVIAQELGWIVALTISSAVVAVLAAITIAIAASATRSANKRSNMPAETQQRAAEAELKLDASKPSPQSEPKPTAAAAPGDDIKQQLAAFIAGNPGIAMGGAAAIVALLGPSKTLKYASRAIMLAQLASNIKQQVDTPSANGRHASADARAASRAGARTGVPPTR